ncbi:hypothetical protein MMC14_004885 [Varicellaria rhodocarpa]|nr:hypothetical protein [Varicellaria rhodocarpa]
MAVNPGGPPQEISIVVQPSHLDRNQKQKQLQEAEDPLPLIREEPIQKQPRTSLTGGALEETSIQTVGTDVYNNTHSIRHWVQQGSWPKEYFEQNKKIRKHLQQKSLFEEVRHEDWFKEQFEDFKNESWFKGEYGEHSNISSLPTKRKSNIHRLFLRMGSIPVLVTKTNQ